MAILGLRKKSIIVGAIVAAPLLALAVWALAFHGMAAFGIGGDGKGLAIVHGRLIDGNGGIPIEDSAVVILDGRIESAGAFGIVSIPKRSRAVDASGMTVLPGFINAHVHHSYSASNLSAWAQAGVTTVRDEGIVDGYHWRAILKSRESFMRPEYARIVSASPMLGPLNGYCQLPVFSADDASQKVNDFIEAGIDVIKLSLEDGIEGRTDMPLTTPEEYHAIIKAAHDREIPVSAHVTDARFLQPMLDAGVDDIAHICYDTMSEKAMRDMVAEDIYLVPTLTVYMHYGGLHAAMENLRRYVGLGGKVAMGNDYADTMKQFGFELGMPMRELTFMGLAGMTPMQIIVASTKNAAHVCGRENDIGTLEAGKIADLLVVGGNPLTDLSCLMDVRIVIKDGDVIRHDKSPVAAASAL